MINPMINPMINSVHPMYRDPWLEGQSSPVAPPRVVLASRAIIAGRR